MLPLAWFVLLWQDQATVDYLSRVGHKISRSAEVRFVNDTDVRATALPGDRVEVSTGLFARLQNEAELAGVIAHELAHRAAATQCIRFVHIRGLHEAGNQDDRPNEAKADQTAIQVLTKAGYNPMAMLEFFSKYRRAATDLPQNYSAEDLLLEKLELEATDHPLKDVILNTPEFERFHDSVK
jgi:beta-barrel assembly-enhancing protease